MERKYLIVGGGVAGLACAIRLAELGERPTLIEAGSYPSHKVCGEFLSPECLPILKRWNITPHPIDTIRFGTLTLNLKNAAGSCSRYELDTKLAQKAIDMGVDVQTKTRVKNPTAETLIISAGRLVHPPSPPKYIGFKAHFSGIQMDNTLEMHAFPGGYFGISPIDDNTVNVACLAKPGAIDPESLNRFPILRSAQQLFPWLEIKAPAFGPKKLPKKPNTFFVGDAAGTIPPACGDGLAMGITSGVMCAEYAIRQDAEGFHRAWQKRYAPRIRFGKLLHNAMLHPQIANLSSRIPLLPSLIFNLTRES